MAICNDDLVSGKPKHFLIAVLIIYFFVALYYFWCFESYRGVSAVPWCSSVPGLSTCLLKYQLTNDMIEFHLPQEAFHQ